jgi:hypothetical protein
VGKSPTWTLTYVVTAPLTYEVEPLRGVQSYVDGDLRGHGLVSPTWTSRMPATVPRQRGVDELLHSSSVIRPFLLFHDMEI